MVKLPPEPMTLKEAAAFAGLTESTLRVLLFNERIKGVKVGQSWIVAKAEVRAYLKTRRPRAKPEKA